MHPVRHEDDALVRDLGPPEGDCSLVEVDLLPVDVGDLAVSGPCVQQEDDQVVVVLHEPLELRRVVR